MTQDATRVDLRTDRDFRRYIGARAVSLVGSLVSIVALPVLVYQLTGSSAWTAAVAASEAAPYLVFGLVAGAVADRVRRRELMVRMEIVTGVALASIPIAWYSGVLTATQVIVVGFVVQTCFVFFDAANFGALPTLVGKERLTSAFSTLYATTTSIELVVPALAGVLVASLAPAALVSVNVVTAVAAAMLVAGIRAPLSVPTRGKVDIATGLRFLWQNKVVRTLTFVGTTHAVGAGAWVAMLVPWADKVLGIAPSGDVRLGALFSCWGVGGLAASRLVPMLSRRFRPARVTLGALPISLVCGLLVLASSYWLVALPAAVLWGAAHSTVVLNAITYRQQEIPVELQSRVNTTCRMLSWGIGQPLGAALAGFVSVSAGPRGGLAAGLCVLAAGVAAAWITPVLRRNA
ncbi:MFS transporter [Kibdelosporangium persicum]|uniref:Transmembrane secretion effector n=1 Tax=Kibdelosporangium persicum TaxID=2698649 RepID=A0ABX2FE82_9PSEU|nr:MFS transporter [Kibdelosporangium persicum]NRN69592.1 Transmembrane secretion effector [Kibdelosporangium persicum]